MKGYLEVGLIVTQYFQIIKCHNTNPNIFVKYVRIYIVTFYYLH